MLFITYVTCGILYSFHTFKRIFENREAFNAKLEEEVETSEDIDRVLQILFLSCLLAWPFMMLIEIKNRQDFE